jgi:hypothetical protein
MGRVSTGLTDPPTEAVIVIADMFGISGRRCELVEVLRRSERASGAEPTAGSLA